MVVEERVEAVDVAEGLPAALKLTHLVTAPRMSRTSLPQAAATFLLKKMWFFPLLSSRFVSCAPLLLFLSLPTDPHELQERQIDPIMDIQTSSFEVGNMAVNYIEDLKLHGFHIGLPLPPPGAPFSIASIS